MVTREDSITRKDFLAVGGAGLLGALVANAGQPMFRESANRQSSSTYTVVVDDDEGYCAIDNKNGKKAFCNSDFVTLMNAVIAASPADTLIEVAAGTFEFLGPSIDMKYGISVACNKATVIKVADGYAGSLVRWYATSGQIAGANWTGGMFKESTYPYKGTMDWTLFEMKAKNGPGACVFNTVSDIHTYYCGTVLKFDVDNANGSWINANYFRDFVVQGYVTAIECVATDDNKKTGLGGNEFENWGCQATGAGPPGKATANGLLNFRHSGTFINFTLYDFSPKGAVNTMHPTAIRPIIIGGNLGSAKAPLAGIATDTIRIQSAELALSFETFTRDFTGPYGVVKYIDATKHMWFNLPDPTNPCIQGRIFIVKRIDNTNFNVELNTHNGGTIDGMDKYPLNPSECVMIHCDGVNFHVIGQS